MKMNKIHVIIALSLFLMLSSSPLTQTVNGVSTPNLGSFYYGQSWIREGAVITGSMVNAAGGGWNSYPNINMTQEPCIIYENSVFKMWFLTDYGNQGYATSTDGIHWNIYNSPVLTGSDLVHAFVYRNGTFNYDFYGIGPDGQKVVLYTSTDGINWILASSTCLINGTWDELFGNVAIFKRSSTWYMVYEAKLGSTPYKIGYATSTDGITWTKFASNPVLTVSGQSVGGPFVSEESDGYYYMWIHKSAGNFLPTDLYIVRSTNLQSWNYYPDSSPILTRQNTDEGIGQDYGQVADPMPIVVNGITYLYYTATKDQVTFVIKLVRGNISISSNFAVETYITATNSTGNLIYGSAVSYDYVHDKPIAFPRNASFELDFPLVIGQVKSGSYYLVYRSFLYFDTKIIPEGATLLNATLELFVEDNNLDSADKVIIQNGQPTYPRIPLGSSDFYYEKYTGNYGEILEPDIVEGQYNPIEIVSSIINKGGLTKLCLKTYGDIIDVAPSTSETISIGGYEYSLVPRLHLWYFTGAKIVVTASNSTGRIFVDGNFAGTGTATIGVTPGPHSVSFQPLKGYDTPLSQSKTLVLGDAWAVTGTYALTAPPSGGLWILYGLDLGVGLSLSLISVITSIVGYKLADAVDHGVAGASLGFMIGLYICAHYNVIPVFWFIIASLIFSGLFFMWWRRD